MFLDELNPLTEKILQSPIAFLGGFVSGVFHLNLNDDPVKQWLESQSGESISAPTASRHDGNSNGNGDGQGPQSIEIE
ncbi:hypothetical protein [Geitlerinema sp. PCC 9228]|jgi:hypothetical protein|uniref:hypothetical protein n=1 Tax=Geitlerinema sp. PCC 9228 TaxID=111611 RepID=UPI0008F9C8DA|nr:hypothetical protein [Geitlerinema sp. PCC 9228]